LIIVKVDRARSISQFPVDFLSQHVPVNFCEEFGNKYFDPKKQTFLCKIIINSNNNKSKGGGPGVTFRGKGGRLNC